MKTKIIINADDFGYSQKVNDSIKSFIDAGLITSTTIMANGNAFEDAVKFAKATPNISFGVHLNLTEFESLTNSPIFKKRNILQSKGLYKFNTNRVSFELLNAIKLEWSAQIEKCLQAGIKISHIDGHHSIHAKPFLFPALKYVQKKFGINKIRNTMNLSDNLTFRQIVQRKLYSFLLKNYIKTKTTDFFTSYEEFVGLKEMPQPKTLELMCHPGGVGYLEEENLIREKKLLSIFKFDLEFINWNQL